MDVSFFLIEPRRGSKVRASSLRYGRRKANVHWTLCDVYRSLQNWYWLKTIVVQFDKIE